MRNHSPFLVLALAVLVTACEPAKPSAGGAAAQAAPEGAGVIETLKAEMARLRAENAQLRLTPSGLAAEVEEAVKAGDVAKAQDSLNRLVERFPASPEVPVATPRVEALVAKLRAEQEEHKRLAAIGFKALKDTPVFSHGDTTVNLASANLGKTWKYDSYGHGWKYLEAEKGKKFLLVKATVASNSKEPLLPGIAAYVADGAVLTRLGNLRYRFARWQDYGSFLGNHADYRNDFAHTHKIPFSLGVALGDEQLGRRPIYLVATREGCHTRTYERLAQPPVHYVPGTCASLKPALTVDDFKNGSLAVLKRIN